MIRRSACLALLVCGAIWVQWVAPAGAQTPSPNSNYQGCQAFVSDVTVVPGQTVTISGSGANSGDVVAVQLSGTPGNIGSGTADATGNFSFPVTIPDAIAPGVHTFSVPCGPDGGVASLTITVSGPGTGPGTTSGGGVGNGSATTSVGSGSLPRTGTDNVIPLVKLGIAFVALGGLILAATRRRRWAREPALTD